MAQPADVIDFLEFLDGYIGQTDLISGYCHFHSSFILSNLIPSCHMNEDIVKRSDDLKEVVIGEGIRDKVLFTGSGAEGLCVPMFHHTAGTIDKHPGKKQMETFIADLDMMYLITSIKVHDDSSPFYGDVKLEPDGCHLGYTRLMVLNTNVSIPEIDGSVTAIYNKAEYLASSNFYFDLYRDWDKDAPTSVMGTAADKASFVYAHGPASSNETTFIFPSLNFKRTFSFDLVPTIHCPSWPRSAQKWKHRLRTSGWPSTSVISDIASAGCHVVPVAHSSSTVPSIEWRFSFSMAELVLARSMSRIQRKSYMLLKLLCQEGLIPKKVFPSYYLKTLFLWACEDYPQSFWRETNISCILLTLLDRLIFNVGRGYHPNYFMPENNLIDHIPRHILSDILRSLVKIRKDPLHVLFNFNDAKRMESSRYPWRMSFKGVIQDMSDQLESQPQLMRTLKACAYSLHKMGFFNILDWNYRVAESAFLQMAPIMELYTGAEKDRLGFVSAQVMCVPDILPKDHLLEYASSLVRFFGYLFQLYPGKEHQNLLSIDCGRLHLCLAIMQRTYPCMEDGIEGKDNTQKSIEKEQSQSEHGKEQTELGKQDQKEETQDKHEDVLSLLDGDPVNVADILLTRALSGVNEEDHSSVMCDLALLHFLIGNHQKAHAHALQVLQRENALEVASWSAYGVLESCLFQELADRTLPQSHCADPSAGTIQSLINSEGRVVVPSIMMALLLLVCLKTHTAPGANVSEYIEMMCEVAIDIPIPACLILLKQARVCYKNQAINSN